MVYKTSSLKKNVIYSQNNWNQWKFKLLQEPMIKPCGCTLWFTFESTRSLNFQWFFLNFHWFYFFSVNNTYIKFKSVQRYQNTLDGTAGSLLYKISHKTNLLEERVVFCRFAISVIKQLKNRIIYCPSV